MTQKPASAELTLGPNLFNWTPEAWRDFYFAVADEAPVTEVFVGEVVCSKRAPLFDKQMDAVIDRLERAGKRVVVSSLAEVASGIDRRLSKKVATADKHPIEVNDISVLAQLKDQPFTVGPYVNVYNAAALGFFAERGAQSICLSPEIPKRSIALLAEAAQAHGAALEVQVYGRMPLALSARCYHARAHGRTKDSCQFICDADPDGMPLFTLEGTPFLAVNGIQTMSFNCLNLVGEVNELVEMGISRLRISPHSKGTIAATRIFDDVLHGRIDGDAALEQLDLTGMDLPFSNGFYHQQAGTVWQV